MVETGNFKEGSIDQVLSQTFLTQAFLNVNLRRLHPDKWEETVKLRLTHNMAKRFSPDALKYMNLVRDDILKKAREEEFFANTTTTAAERVHYINVLIWMGIEIYNTKPLAEIDISHALTPLIHSIFKNMKIVSTADSGKLQSNDTPSQSQLIQYALDTGGGFSCTPLNAFGMFPESIRAFIRDELDMKGI